MDSKEFFGSSDDFTPTSSPISLVVEACIADFSNAYRARKDGMFNVTVDGDTSCVLTADETQEDIRSWVRELEGDGGAIGKKIITLVRSNPGWETIITLRVLRELRKWAT